MIYKVGSKSAGKFKAGKRVGQGLTNILENAGALKEQKIPEWQQEVFKNQPTDRGFFRSLFGL